MPTMSDVQSGNIKSHFVILAASRSGSNMLCRMLDSHPAILCHHEIYNPKGIRLAVTLRETDFTLGTMAERERDPEFRPQVDIDIDALCRSSLDLCNLRQSVGLASSSFFAPSRFTCRCSANPHPAANKTASAPPVT